MGKPFGFPIFTREVFMKVFMSRYYRDFQCIAGACPDSCCKEWAVDIDDDSANFYRSLPGVLGERLRSVMQTEDGCTSMIITEGRCPMWRQDGLCEIQAQLGHDALCKTCQEFPRLRHDYGDFAELGLELSCPETAKMILSCRDFSMICQEMPGGEEPDYDGEVMEILLRSRQVVLDFIKDCTYPLPQTLAIILLYAHDVQAEIDGAEAIDFAPEAYLADAVRYAAGEKGIALQGLFKDLEILTQRWQALLDADVVDGNWGGIFVPLVGYFVQRYWLQAVSDFDLVCRVKLIIAACLLINSLPGDPLKNAQLFSKEIENDPDNVEAILDGAYCQPELTDVNLLRLLLG